MPGHRHKATLTSIQERELLRGSLSLDDTRLPYMRATAEVASTGTPINLDTLQPLANSNNGIFTLERFPADSTVADQSATFNLASRRLRLNVDGTLTVDFTSAELHLGDLRNPYVTLSLAVPGDISALTVGAALTWLFTDFLVNDVVTPGFTLTGTVPSMPIELPDGASQLTLPEGAELLTWMDAHLARYGKVLRCNESNQFIIADRENVTAGTLTVDCAVNVLDYSETIDRDSEQWANQVSVHFEEAPVLWISNFPEPNAPSTVVTKIAYIDRSDVPSPFNQFTVDPEAVAQGIFNRHQLRYKTIDCRMISDYTVRPGQAANITNPLGELYTARVQSVEWFFPDGEMAVTFRNVEPV